MARIAYAIAGEGGGHASRNSVIISKLAEQGHVVDVFTSFRTYDELSVRFKNSKRVKVHKIPGLSFAFNPDKGKVSIRRTLRHNFWTVVKYPRTAYLFRKKAKQGNYDLFIYDHDFVFSIANVPYARKNKIPTIMISHFAGFQLGKFNAGKKIQNKIRTLKLLLNLFNPKADIMLLNAFYKPDVIKDPGVKFVGPLLKQEVYKHKPTDKGFVLIYINRPLEKTLYSMLSMIKDYKFIVYTRKPELFPSKPHIKIKKFSPSFVSDLASCTCVIGPAGIELPSEAVYYEKPMLAIPAQNQAEQAVNGFYIEKLGIGKNVLFDDLTVSSILIFLKNKEKYKNSIRKFKKTRFKIGTDEVMKEINRVLKKTNKK
jgi:uncharacterized protein (TIGR00661 family)